jgi:ribosomal protein S18 acetylase RimI-like enzyme
VALVTHRLDPPLIWEVIPVSPHHIQRSTDPEVARVLRERIDEHNMATTGIREWHPLTFVVKDDDGELAGGIDGWEWGGACYLSSLWVRDDRRGDGIGSALMDDFEAEARRLGCRQVVLETHSFQAPAFYARRGFVRCGEVAGYPRGQAFILMAKTL